MGFCIEILSIRVWIVYGDQHARLRKRELQSFVRWLGRVSIAVTMRILPDILRL